MKYQILKNDSIQITHPKPRLPVNLYRVVALKDFSVMGFDVKEGDIGGYIQSEQNLSQDDLSWITNNGKVFDSVKLTDSLIRGDARVFGNCNIKNSQIAGRATVYENAIIEGSFIGSNCIVNGHTNLSKVFMYNSSQITGTSIVTDSELHDGCRISGESVVEDVILYGTCEIKSSKVENCKYTGRIVVVNDNRKDETLTYEPDLQIEQGDLDKRVDPFGN